jgi:hypothetical protein
MVVLGQTEAAVADPRFALGGAHGTLRPGDDNERRLSILSAARGRRMIRLPQACNPE